MVNGLGGIGGGSIGPIDWTPAELTLLHLTSSSSSLSIRSSLNGSPCSYETSALQFPLEESHQANLVMLAGMGWPLAAAVCAA